MKRSWWILPLVLTMSGCLGSESHPGARHLLQVTGQVGVVKPFEARSQVEHDLGSGRMVSRRQQDAGGTVLTFERVRYATANLDIVYVSAPSQQQRTFMLRTADAAYQTSDRIGVGSTYDHTRNAKSMSCRNVHHPDAEGTSADCQIGLGSRHPIVVFKVHDGRVIEVVMAASAD
jgi:hypothetical protein